MQKYFLGELTEEPLMNFETGGAWNRWTDTE